MTAPPPPSGRREAIIQTATALFAEHGFSAVGMRTIADAVGIRASSLYHHFPSKLDLLHAVSLVATEAFITAQLPELERAGVPPGARLARVLRDHVLYFHAHRLEETVGLRELAVLRTQAPALYEDVQRHRRGYQHALQAVIEEGVATGEFDVPDAHLATLALLGLVNSVNGWFDPRGAAGIEAVADAYVAMGVGRLLGSAAAFTPAASPKKTKKKGKATKPRPRGSRA